jgi:hypothetical protein
MISFLLLFLAVTTVNFPQPVSAVPLMQSIIKENIPVSRVAEAFSGSELLNEYTIYDMKQLLTHEAPNLNPLVVKKVLTTLKCAKEFNVEHNHILTLIDYSLPSNKKRFWVFDIKEKKLLFHTYVSHGIKSGALLTNYFSNKYNSKASSIGVYQTLKAYYGRDGLSLRLDGLDRSFNDNASNRAVVMHSGWYVEERFIKRYGRPGRSWGCPALPLAYSQDIINTIKDKSLLVVYYPSDAWFAKSKFLNCNKNSALSSGADIHKISEAVSDEHREAILFVGSGYKGTKQAETKPVVVISADIYERVFNTVAPLSRMLRRQINNAEYVALSTTELSYLIQKQKTDITKPDVGINAIQFVIPVLKVVRGGYYETQMQVVNLGKIKDIRMNGIAHASSFTVDFEGKSSVNLNAHDEFIRWVGL